MKINRPKSRLIMPDNAKLVHDGVIFKAYQWPQKMYDGSTTTFEKLKRSDTVNIIAVVDGRIILTKQEQPGHSEPFISCLGGAIDNGESPLDAAKRELLEESGMKSDDWVLWKAVQLIEKIDWATYILVARNCKKVTGTNLDGGEKIDLVDYSFDEFIHVTKQENYRDLEVLTSIVRDEHANGSHEQLRRLIIGT